MPLNNFADEYTKLHNVMLENGTDIDTIQGLKIALIDFWYDAKQAGLSEMAEIYKPLVNRETGFNDIEKEVK